MSADSEADFGDGLDALDAFLVADVKILPTSVSVTIVPFSNPGM